MAASGHVETSVSFTELISHVYNRHQKKKQAKEWAATRYFTDHTVDTTTTVSDGVDSDEEEYMGGDDSSSCDNPSEEYFAKRDGAQRARFKKDKDRRLSWANLQAAKQLLKGSGTTDYPYLYDWRWEVLSGVSTAVVVGRGDLVFTDGKGNFSIVQLGVYSGAANEPANYFVRDSKWKEKALRFARLFERMHPYASSVVPMPMTNKGLLKYQDQEWSISQACAIDIDNGEVEMDKQSSSWGCCAFQFLDFCW